MTKTCFWSTIASPTSKCSLFLLSYQLIIPLSCNASRILEFPHIPYVLWTKRASLQRQHYFDIFCYSNQPIFLNAIPWWGVGECLLHWHLLYLQRLLDTINYFINNTEINKEGLSYAESIGFTICPIVPNVFISYTPAFAGKTSKGHVVINTLALSLSMSVAFIVFVVFAPSNLLNNWNGEEQVNNMRSKHCLKKRCWGK